jgi:hypothetical protein
VTPELKAAMYITLKKKTTIEIKQKKVCKQMSMKSLSLHTFASIKRSEKEASFFLLCNNVCLYKQ